MKNTLCLLLIALAMTAQAQKSDKKRMRKLIKENISFAVSQYKLLPQNVPAGMVPRTYDAKTNKVVTTDMGAWTSGFYSSTLWYLYENTRDKQIRAEAEKRLGDLEKEKYSTYDHDLGFKMYCSFGNAFRLTNNPHYKDVIFESAKSLATRYRPIIQSLQSWNSSENLKCPVIIDNMMNLELLEWSTLMGSDSKFREIAINHANTTLSNHFRPDGSSYHALDYDLSTGNIIKKVTVQGAADSSAWARGQAWGLYGFVMMHRFEKNEAYLNQARKIASFLLDHPNLPQDKIPYWDFNAPGIPDAFRDASAGAIIASALLELGQFTSGEEKQKYVSAAEKILQSLSSAAYRAAPGTNGGFLLKHSVGSLPHNSEIDVPIVYADYYFIEALTRYKKWYL
jgi:hypothetical protein